MFTLCQTHHTGMMYLKSVGVCKPCQYHCNKKSHYVQHCETEKHKYNAKTFDMHGVRNTQSSDLSIFMKTMMTMQTDLINVLVDVIKNKTIVQSS